MYISLAVVFCFYLHEGASADKLQVEIGQGTLKGEILTTRLGRNFIAFKGIPFAQPPVGDLRFAAPQPPLKWQGIRNNPSHVPICMQVDMRYHNYSARGEEDCLYLNVYLPQHSQGSSLPVMVYFHGGGFMSGSGNYEVYNPTYLLDKDIVLVTGNYRLGPLGFLSTGDEVCPGNAGLKDQTALLRWVKENIASFAGNPDSVTIFGESAGAAAVEFHLLSPMSRGLFHRAIQQSGASTAPWSLAPNGKSTEKTQKLASHLECPDSKDSQAIIKCLRDVDARSIVEAQEIFVEWFAHPYVVFQVVVESSEAKEERFLTDNPHKIYENPSLIASVPVLIGFTTNEGAYLASQIAGNPEKLKEISDNYQTLLPLTTLYKFTSKHPDRITQEVMDFYFPNSSIMEKIFAFSNLFSDAWFYYPLEKVLEAYAKRTAPTYLYSFAYRGSLSFSGVVGEPRINFGVCHVDDLLYLFNLDLMFGTSHRSDSDIQMINVMTNIWTEFAKNGKPPINWAPVKSGPNKSLIEIAGPNELNRKSVFYQERVDFWSAIWKREEEEEESIKDEL